MIQFNNNNITVFQSSIFMTTTAIIQTNKAVIMTDPNWLPSEIEVIKNYINQIVGDKQLYIIYTHSDFDHIIGSGAFPEAMVIASKQFDNNPTKEDVVQKINRFDQEYYLNRNYIPEYPSVDIVVSDDGKKLELESLTMTFYKAPGHTNDGLFTVVEPYGIFLSGDYLSDIEFPFIFSDYNDYVNTVNKAENILLNHNITTHVPGHGSTTQDQIEIQNRINCSKYYLKQLFHDKGELERYLSNKYKFFEGMKSIHFDNKKMIKKGL
ncbi:MBL fold metallo-hydrolase [Virgibacillus sp. C22-A2]|uniref:MBL fold metallo-hydrolase n=1 Tax=Virgibacillus tibetensis TaxID=3042313 RepID=A0ABU6KEM4_9BACI|nr:MBL fold metallo-hydrolase [Virgibacillus sp. C22-A2]